MARQNRRWLRADVRLAGLPGQPARAVERLLRVVGEPGRASGTPGRRPEQGPHGISDPLASDAQPVQCGGSHAHVEQAEQEVLPVDLVAAVGRTLGEGLVETGLEAGPDLQLVGIEGQLRRDAEPLTRGLAGDAQSFSDPGPGAAGTVRRVDVVLEHDLAGVVQLPAEPGRGSGQGVRGVGPLGGNLLVTTRAVGDA